MQNFDTEEKKEEEILEGEVEDTVEEPAEDTTEASEEAETTDDAAEETEEAPKKKSFMDRRKDKKEKKDPRDEKIAELEDKVKRQMAEFDNFRKRTEKEKTAMYEVGAKSIIEKLLPVVDNFDRALATATDEQKADPFVDGMDKVYKQLQGMLEACEVKPIEAVGCEFNAELHNAVMQCDSDEYESGYVAQELQKGYMYRDSVVRHSMVSVVS